MREHLSLSFDVYTVQGYNAKLMPIRIEHCLAVYLVLRPQKTYKGLRGLLHTNNN